MERYVWFDTQLAAKEHPDLLWERVVTKGEEVSPAIHDLLAKFTGYYIRADALFVQVMRICPPRITLTGKEFYLHTCPLGLYWNIFLPVKSPH